MPTNDDTGPTPRDVEIDALSEQVEELDSQIISLQSEVDRASREIYRLEKLVAANSAPTGNVVFLDGVTYPVLSTHRADNTFAEVKRGHVAEGLTLVAINKQH